MSLARRPDVTTGGWKGFSTNLAFLSCHLNLPPLGSRPNALLHSIHIIAQLNFQYNRFSHQFAVKFLNALKRICIKCKNESRWLDWTFCGLRPSKKRSNWLLKRENWASWRDTTPDPIFTRYQASCRLAIPRLKSHRSRRDLRQECPVRRPKLPHSSQLETWFVRVLGSVENGGASVFWSSWHETKVSQKVKKNGQKTTKKWTKMLSFWANMGILSKGQSRHPC